MITLLFKYFSATVLNLPFAKHRFFFSGSRSLARTKKSAALDGSTLHEQQESQKQEGTINTQYFAKYLFQQKMILIRA